MTIPFWKMHGAGNDFILFDDRSQTTPTHDRNWLMAIARRRTGIGCEGIILLQHAEAADFRMRFFNPDGNLAAMCGNGARCAARLAMDLGLASDRMTIATDAGDVEARVETDGVRLSLPAPTDVQPYFDLDIDNESISCGFANTGVPHVVIELQDVSKAPVMRMGATIRYHPHFAPAGTNVNFVQRLTENTLAVRTYERGVEAESGACGTGVAAAAIIMALRKQVTAPIGVTTQSGDRLLIGLDVRNDQPRAVTLSGPAVYVYEGTLPLPSAIDH